MTSVFPPLQSAIIFPAAYSTLIFEMADLNCCGLSFCIFAFAIYFQLLQNLSDLWLLIPFWKCCKFAKESGKTGDDDDDDVDTEEKGREWVCSHMEAINMRAASTPASSAQQSPCSINLNLETNTPKHKYNIIHIIFV